MNMGLLCWVEYSNGRVYSFCLCILYRVRKQLEGEHMQTRKGQPGQSDCAGVLIVVSQFWNSEK